MGDTCLCHQKQPFSIEEREDGKNLKVEQHSEAVIEIKRRTWPDMYDRLGVYVRSTPYSVVSTWYYWHGHRFE